MEITFSENTSYGKNDAIAKLTVDLEKGFEIYSGEMSIDEYDYINETGKAIPTEERTWPVAVIADTFEGITLDENRLKVLVTYDPITESILCKDQKVYTECHEGGVDLVAVASGTEKWDDNVTPFTIEDFIFECLGWRDVVLI